MKRLLFFGATLISGLLQSQINVLECTPENSKITQQEFVGPQAEISKPCVVFDGQNYNFSGNQQKTITAYDEIQIKNNFQAKPTGNGEVHLKADKGDFDVFCMNYPDLLHVLKYKKLELGITIPNEVQEKINNFHTGTEPKINPYLDWEIRVSADFTHPNLPYTISIDGFYNKEFTEWMTPIDQIPTKAEGYTDAEYRALGGYTEQPTDKPFLFRFAPNLKGKWSCVVHIYIPNQAPYDSEPFSFTVVESGSPGYVTVSENKRYFELGGQPFYPVGCNVLWPITRAETDPELFNKTNVYEEYRAGVHAVPRVYDNYKNTLNALIDGGGNCFRSIMYPASTDIEFEKLGDYTERLTMAQEMDEMLELFENRGALFVWDLQIHYSLMYSEMVYGKNWAWDNLVYDANGNSYGYCYKTLPGVNNPIDFLTNTQAKEYYKQRLRYILARWGYSTNIALFEIMSETNLLVPSMNPGDQNFYSEGENWKIFRDWNVEMATYLKSHWNGALHLTTTSYAGEKKREDNTFYNDAFDVMSLNMYDFGRPDFGSFLRKFVNERQLNEISYDCYTWHNVDGNLIRKIKPLIYSETGILDKDCPNTMEPQRNFNDELKLMYQIPFSGLAGGFSWSFWFHPNLYHHLGKIRRSIYNVPRLTSGNWFPGAMKKNSAIYSTDYWYYSEERGSTMTGKFNPQGNGNNDIRDRRVDLMYLRSGDRNLASGVLTNKTLNFLTLDDCFDSEYDEFVSEQTAVDIRWEIYDQVLLSPQSSFSVWGEEIELTGLRNNRYYLNYYYPSNLSNPIDVQDNNGENIRLSCTLFNEQVVFEARREGHTWQHLLYPGSIQEIDPEILVARAAERNNTVTANDTILQNNVPYDIMIFPNPTTDKLTVQFGLGNIGSEMQISDLRGTILETRKLNFEKNSFNLVNFTTGTYLIQIKLPNDEIKIFKVEKL
ncbi:MAG: T9SS type A sorting domain-containing protein [Bacteroidota bacterium]